MAESKKKTVSKDSEKSTKSATKSIKKVKAPVEKKKAEAKESKNVKSKSTVSSKTVKTKKVDSKVDTKKEEKKASVKKATKAVSEKNDSKKGKNSSKKTVPKVSSKTTKLSVVSIPKEKKTTSKSKSLKEKSATKSRLANTKKVSSRKIKREATRIIPVDKILEAQRKLDEEENNLGIDIVDDRKKKTIKRKSKKKIKNKNNFKSIFSKTIKKIKNLFDFSSLSPKTRKIMKYIIFGCIALIIIEGIYLLVLKNTILRGTYYDSFNSICLDGSDMIAVGSSDFKHSKNNKYQKEAKAKIIKYDKNGNVLFEKMYDEGINSLYSSIICTNDGYVAVGSYAKDNSHSNDNLHDAIIVKYDKDGNELWKNTFSSLSNTRFNKVINVEDGYVVIGQSIYANMEMGNSKEGGGVILKYSKDGELLWKNFHGGTKSASFNGIVEVNGWLYVVGRDGTDFGNIVQYNGNGVYQWHKNYRYTDTLGLSDIVYKNNKLYAVGSKEIFDIEVTDDSERNTTNTDALLICFGLDGEVVFEKTFGGTKAERFNSVVVYKNSIVAVGSSNSSDSGLKIFTDGTKTTGILVKYDLNGNSENKMALGGSSIDNMTNISTDSSSLFITSYTNSKDGNISTKVDNGKDYFGRIIKLDSRLHTLFLK